VHRVESYQQVLSLKHRSDASLLLLPSSESQHDRALETLYSGISRELTVSDPCKYHRDTCATYAYCQSCLTTAEASSISPAGPQCDPLNVYVASIFPAGCAQDHYVRSVVDCFFTEVSKTFALDPPCTFDTTVTPLPTTVSKSSLTEYCLHVGCQVEQHGN
jgi:hypothetical protein